MVDPRRKGNRGEAEIEKWFREQGIEIMRTGYAQQRWGAVGSDLVIDQPGFPRFDIEVKRTEVARLPSWRRQARRSADRAGGIPRIYWRSSGQEWLSIGWLRDDLEWARTLTGLSGLPSLRGDPPTGGSP